MRRTALLAAVCAGAVCTGAVCAAVLAACAEQPSAGPPPAEQPSTGQPSTGQPSTGPSPSAAVPPSTAAGVERSNRLMLAKARRMNAPAVILRVVAEPERTAEAIAGLEALGGVLSTSELSAGSLRLSMPTENVERAAALPAVASMTVEQVPPRGATRHSSPPPR